MTRIALGIEYNGAAFYGWQRQKNVNSIQQELEKALKAIAQQDIDVFCAGRTDAGVHATNQVVHFDTTVQRPLKAWTMGTNTNLPDTITVKWAKEVSQDFHARFSATARRYRYIIYNKPLRPGIFLEGVSHYYLPLDDRLMELAAQSLPGEHDFTSFRAANCQSNTPCRNIYHAKISRIGDYVMLDIKANAFLHHMVRNIMGSLIKIGEGEQGVAWIKKLLELKDRTQAAATAKPNGLFLVEVQYPEAFGIPKCSPGPLYMPD